MLTQSKVDSLLLGFSKALRDGIEYENSIQLQNPTNNDRHVPKVLIGPGKNEPPNYLGPDMS